MGQGKHLKLRLSKGTCRFDAIFFSATAEECGVAPGTRVDAAFYLQANTFRGSTTLQLQMVDIRPSLTPSRHEAADLDLLGRLVEGTRLTAQKRPLRASGTSLPPTGWYWSAAALRQDGGGPAAYLRQRHPRPGGCESFLRAAPGTAGLCGAGTDLPDGPGDRLALCLNPIQGKVDLFACPYLARLHDAADRNRGDRA